jgi:hypothetical protein
MTTVPPQRHIETALSAVICAMLLIWLTSLVVARAQWPESDLSDMLTAASRPVASGAAPGPDVGTPCDWWKMNGTDTNATQVLDASNTNNATVVGAVYVSTNGSFYTLNGSSQYFSMGNPSTDLQFTTGAADLPFTVSVWAFLADTTGAYCVFGKGNGTATQYELFLGSAMHLREWTSPGTGGRRSFVADSNPCVAAQWHHYVFAMDGTNGLSMYRDATNIVWTCTTTTTYSAMAKVAAASTIGQAGGYYYYKGSVDDISVFSNKLSATQITNIYQRGRTNP